MRKISNGISWTYLHRHRFRMRSQNHFSAMHSLLLRQIDWLQWNAAIRALKAIARLDWRTLSRYITWMLLTHILSVRPHHFIVRAIIDI